MVAAGRVVGVVTEPMLLTYLAGLLKYETAVDDEPGA